MTNRYNREWVLFIIIFFYTSKETKEEDDEKSSLPRGRKSRKEHRRSNISSLYLDRLMRLSFSDHEELRLVAMCFDRWFEYCQ